MIEKLKDIYARYEELSEKMSDPAVISDTAEWTKIAKAQSELAETAQKYAEYAEVERRKAQAEDAIKTEPDLEMRELFYTEIEDCKQKLSALTEELKVLLLPKDKNDDRNCIIEIRGGAGGEEAALFAYELYRMYLN